MACAGSTSHPVMHQGDEAAYTIEVANVCTGTVRAAATDARAAAYRAAAAICTTRHANAAARVPVDVHASAACKPAGLLSARYADVSTDEFGNALARAPYVQRPAAIFAATARNGTWSCTRTCKSGPNGFAATTNPVVASRAFVGSPGRSPVADTYDEQAGVMRLFTEHSPKRLRQWQFGTAAEEAEFEC